MRSSFASPVEAVREAGLSGGIVVQVGSDDMSLKALSSRFHVRLLLPDAAAVNRAQQAIDQVALTGRFTADVWDGKRLPFADRVVNVLVLAQDGLVSDAEARRVLVPRGLLIRPGSVRAKPLPATVDEWTHFLYDAGGNAVSKDREVAPPRSLRWRAPPLHMRSHNYSASFLGLVTAAGRLFHFLDEGSYLYDKGGLTERWSLVARDAFNGALLWKRPLKGYGQPFFEDVSGQAVPNLIWRSPLSMNRRLVAQGRKVYVALCYRAGPLSILDGATGEVLHEVDVGGCVDEIVAAGDLVICRVRTEIDAPTDAFVPSFDLERKLRARGLSHEDVRREMAARHIDHLMKQKLERIVAVDAAGGRILWRSDAPVVAHESLAMADGKVVFHNYRALVGLDTRSGRRAWEVACPVVKPSLFGVRGLLGNLLIAEGKVVWTSRATGGGLCLNLADGRCLWRNKLLGETGGFAAPTALRAIRGVAYYDYSYGPPFSLADGTRQPWPDVGGMLARGHHIRCFRGRATERFLITPNRGVEFIDLDGNQSVPNDWVRGGCSYGSMPANGLLYNSPEPCTCYVGARIAGFTALSAKLPEGLDAAPLPDSPQRLDKGPACGDPVGKPSTDDWIMYRADAMRSGRARGGYSATLRELWRRQLGGRLTQATLAAGRAFVVRKRAYELLCLNQANGAVLWRRSFPAALDGPPTVVGKRLFIGCRDGHVYSLRATDGELAWRFLATPLERLTLGEDRLEGLWPVSSSVLFHDGLVYAVAGRNSFLDGGIHVYALDPASGDVRHHLRLDGPRLTDEEARTAVVTERDLAKAKDPASKAEILKAIQAEPATGYDMEGADADLLATDSDGRELYMRQVKFTAGLEQVPLRRKYITGFRPMGGRHVMANFGMLDDTMFHRAFWMFDDCWPGCSGGSGWAARAGTMVVIGREHAYAAKHYEQGWYPTHKPGSGNRLVCDTFDTRNLPGDQVPKELNRRLRQYGNPADLVRTAAPVWETTVPIIVRAMLVADAGKGPSAGSGQAGELVFAAGIVEGRTKSDWDESTRYRGPGKLRVHRGADGKLLAEVDLPACPVYDGMSAAGGRLFVSLINGALVCLDATARQAPDK
jgi:outer membrane protein assembly factor BamB